MFLNRIFAAEKHYVSTLLRPWHFYVFGIRYLSVQDSFQQLFCEHVLPPTIVYVCTWFISVFLYISCTSIWLLTCFPHLEALVNLNFMMILQTINYVLNYPFNSCLPKAQREHQQHRPKAECACQCTAFPTALRAAAHANATTAAALASQVTCWEHGWTRPRALCVYARGWCVC